MSRDSGTSVPSRVTEKGVSDDVTSCNECWVEARTASVSELLFTNDSWMNEVREKHGVTLGVQWTPYQLDGVQVYSFVRGSVTRVTSRVVTVLRPNPMFGSTDCDGSYEMKCG